MEYTDEPRDYFFPFLGKIIRQISFDRARYKGRKKRSAVILELSQEVQECTPGADSVEAQMEQAEFVRSMNAFLKTIPSEQRKVFLRRYWYMDSIREIASSYHMSESKVKSMLHRTRALLKQYLQKEGVSI